MDDIKKRIGKRFGDQWSIFKESMKEDKKLFLDWVSPLKPDFFKGKVILDAGCGGGHLTYCALEFGAKKVVAVDVGDKQIELSKKRLKSFQNVEVIKADLENLPYKNKFDFIYSIGVIHHTVDPKKAFKNLVRALKPNGTLCVWVYGDAGILLYALKFIRIFTTRMPIYLVKVSSFLTAAIVYPFSKFVRKLNLPVPQKDFFCYLSKLSFRYVYLIIFDQYVPPISRYYKKEEFERFFKDNRLKNISITPRNNNSWRGIAIK